MDYPIVYDKFSAEFTSMGLAVLENASSVKIKEVINGEFLLSFILPRTDPKWQHIQPENFVKVYDCSQKKDQLFRIRGFDEQRDSSGKLTSNIQCEHVYYDAHDCKFFPTVELIGKTPSQILSYAFAGTRFTIGTVEITKLTDIMLDKVYPSEIVSKLIENVGGELIKDNWTINLVTKRGSNTGVQFRFGKNIATLKKSTDSKGIITRLYPYGKDGLQIAGSLGYIDSPLIGNYDRPRIGHIDYKDIEDPAKLLTEALKEWTTSDQDGIDKPRVTYSGEFIELKKLKEYGDFEAFGLGDIIRIIDEGLETDTTQRIMEYDYYPYEPKRSTVNMSNTKPSVYKGNRPSNIIGNTITTGNYVNSITDSSKKLDPGWFQNIKKKLRTLFNGGLREAVMHKTGDIWVDNPDNPTKAMGILADGFAIANSKLPNGDWNWKTFGTADGFVADMIVTGILKAIDIEGVTITGSVLNGAEMNGGDIDIETDLKVGANIFLRLLQSGRSTIYFGTSSANSFGLIRSDPVDGNFIIGFPSGAHLIMLPNGTMLINCNNVTVKGTWDCSNAIFPMLWDGNSYYATRNWAAQKGVNTGIDSHSHIITIDGVTYTTSANTHNHGQK